MVHGGIDAGDFHQLRGRCAVREAGGALAVPLHGDGVDVLAMGLAVAGVGLAHPCLGGLHGHHQCV